MANKRKGKAPLLGFTIGSSLILAARLLRDVDIESSRLDAEILLAHVLGKTRLELMLAKDVALSDEMATMFFRLIERRLCYEPIAYLIGQQEFFGLDFVVSHDCLIPRPDTEVVVEKCLSLLEKDSSDLVIDLCTGSGAIIVSILKERPKLRAIASDISPRALAIAHGNAVHHGVDDRLSLRAGDLFQPYKACEKAALVVSNPPYIGCKEMATLSPTVREHEPHLALDAGDEEGINFYRRILAEAPKFLAPKGFLVMEIGFSQAEEIRTLIGPEWESHQVFKDLGSRDRCMVLQRREGNENP